MDRASPGDFFARFRQTPQFRAYFLCKPCGVGATSSAVGAWLASLKSSLLILCQGSSNLCSRRCVVKFNHHGFFLSFLRVRRYKLLFSMVFLPLQWPVFGFLPSFLSHLSGNFCPPLGVIQFNKVHQFPHFSFSPTVCRFLCQKSHMNQWLARVRFRKRFQTPRLPPIQDHSRIRTTRMEGTSHRSNSSMAGQVTPQDPAGA